MGKSFTYRMRLDDGTEHVFVVDIERGPSAPMKRGALPVWTALDEHKCPNCPLASTDDALCPAARDLVPLVDGFAKVSSIARVQVRVVSADREVMKETDAQTALGSLMGLLMATSGCPVLAPLKPLAVMHHPFATSTETLYRTISLHLVRAFLDEREPDIEALRAFYDGVDLLNFAFAKRLQAAVQRDANLNALVILQSSGALVGLSIDDGLARLRRLLS